MGRVGLRPEIDVREAYAARAVNGEIDFSGVECPSDGSFLAFRSHAAAVLRRRVADLMLARELFEGEAPSTLLHVGAGEGALLSMASTRMEVEAVGMEPMVAWATQGKEAGLHIMETVPELGDTTATFDLVAEHHLLNRIPEPRRHLRALCQLLSDEGILVLEVPNLLNAPRPLAGGYLSPLRPHVFTQRSLVTMCQRAGLEVLHVEEGVELRVFCRRLRRGATRDRSIPVGPSSEIVVKAVRSNDVRLRLKRVLAAKQATPEVMRVAARAYEVCTWTPGKADIAIEIAAALERAQRWEEAAVWLRRSLLDRKDPDVACMAIRCESVARAVARGQTGAGVTAGPELGGHISHGSPHPISIN